jgi:NAD(P)-dependent dehydrogenase (short-subunit alcohol dehydrogenase family)
LPEAPQVKPEHLGTLHTLKDVADFLGAGSGAKRVNRQEAPTDLTPSLDILLTTNTERKEHAAEQNTAPARDFPEPSRQAVIAAPAPTARISLPGNQERVDRSILQIVDLDTTIPRPRVPLAAGDEVWVVGDPDPLTETATDLLAAQGFIAKAFGWSGPAPLKIPTTLAGLILLAPEQPLPSLNRKAFEWLKLVGPQLRSAGRNGAASLVTVARLDGAFGLADLAPETDPTSGGLAGLAKTARHEWAEVSCKAVDLAPGIPYPEAAAALVDEFLSLGPVEVGIDGKNRCTLELARTVRRPTGQSINLGPKDVILVTGGARGVTAEAAVALAELTTATMILTGRTSAPSGPEPEWLASLTTEAEIKKAVAERLGADAGPKQVGEQYAKLMAQREVRRTIQRIEQTGAKVAYYSVNSVDGKAVADLLHQVRIKYGPVTVLVHGAGVLADKRIEDLTGEQFDRVYSTKVEGVRHLLDLLTNEELKALVMFSSTTARLGRTGQAAYACANEVLNKTAQVESRRRPGCRVTAINWGPWEGGMVTPGLRKMFESEGVGLIPLQEGAMFVAQELSAGKVVEVIALGKMRPGNSGAVPQPAPATANGHVVPERCAPAAPTGNATPPNHEMAPAFERLVDTETHSVLKSHVIDGRAVLPMALHLEWLAHAAMHGNPGLLFHGFNDLRVTCGVQIDGNSSTVIRAFAGKTVKQEKFFVVPVELRSRRKDGREVLHSRAEIVLATALPPAPPTDRPPVVRPLEYTIPTAYRELLFHGPMLQGIKQLEGVEEKAFIGSAASAPLPTAWFQSPLRSSWVADPLVLDVSFQMMILWTQYRHQSGSLPCFASRYRQFRKGFPAEPTRIIIRIGRDEGNFVRSDIDYLDSEGRVVAQMQDYECLMEPKLNRAFRRNQLPTS